MVLVTCQFWVYGDVIDLLHDPQHLVAAIRFCVIEFAKDETDGLQIFAGFFREFRGLLVMRGVLQHWSRLVEVGARREEVESL